MPWADQTSGLRGSSAGVVFGVRRPRLCRGSRWASCELPVQGGCSSPDAGGGPALCLPIVTMGLRLRESSDGKAFDPNKEASREVVQAMALAYEDRP